MSKESDSYRLTMLRRFEQINGAPAPSEVLEAEKVVAKFREEQARARETIHRLRSPLPKEDSCPACHYLHDREVLLVSVEHDDPRHFELWKCNVCGYEEERKAGL
jgi:rubredoxin